MKQKSFVIIIIILALLLVGDLILSLNFYFPGSVRFFLRNILQYDLLSAFVTLFVGLFAIYLYKKQRKDNKINAAKLIIQEIRYAEQQIRNARMLAQNRYYLANRLLPTNNWDNNIHFFVRDLLENQIDLISQFYSQAAYLDKVIGIISDEKNKTYVVRIQGTTPGQLVSNQILLPSGHTLSPDTNFAPIAEEILEDVSKKIEFIYNSPAVDKLREIAEGEF